MNDLTYYIGGRRSGRTSKLIAWMAENPDGIFITFSGQAAHAAWSQAKAMGFEIDESRFISYSQVRGGVLIGHDRSHKVVIDNVEFLFDYFAMSEVKAVAGTGNVVKLGTLIPS